MPDSSRSRDGGGRESGLGAAVGLRYQALGIAVEMT